MPLLLRGALAWMAGTAAGLAGLPVAVPSIVGATAAVAAIARGRGRMVAALTMMALAGLQLGADLAQADARCLESAARATAWTARVLAPAATGSFVRAELLAPGCVVRLAIAVRSGKAESGSVVHVTGAEPSVSDRGLLLRDARLTLVRAPGPLARWRNHVARTLDHRFGSDAPMVRALLIADSRGLDPDLRDRYADAGLVHILSISGLHVAIVGGALLLLFESLRLSRTAAGAAAVAVTFIYVVAIGAPPPAARSATLFAATILARALQRPVSPWGTFALGALVPLLEPRTVLDLGWQLSVSGYAAIIVSARVGRRHVPAAWRGWRAGLARELVAGVLTTMVTAPLVAWHFGRLSLVSPLSNLAAGPVVSMLQPTLFLAMLAPFGPLADFVADASRPLLRALDGVAAVSASLPGAAVVVAPTFFAAVLSGVVAFSLLIAGWARHPRPPLIVATSSLALLAWIPAGISRGLPVAEVHLLDVGQGDAIALRTPRGRWVVIDAGRSWSSGDAGRATVIPYLRRRGGALALLVLTHPHADVIGGAASVVRALRPREVRDAAFVERSAGYRELLATVAATGSRWQRVRPGEQLDIDGVLLDFLAPDSAWTASLDDPNEASTVVRATFGGVRVLLTGDAERREEEWLVARDAAALRADVLKVGHHGSPTSTTPAFLEAVAPRIALVSVGLDNVYGHPGPEVMRRLAEQGATVLRTDQLGTVVLRTDGTSIEVEAAGHRWTAAARRAITAAKSSPLPATH